MVVILLENSRHMLQVYDQKTDKGFQREVRCTRDILQNIIHFSWANTAVKIKLAVAAYKAQTPDIARV